MKNRLSVVAWMAVVSLMIVSCKDKNNTDDNETPASTTGKISLAINTQWQGAPYSNTSIVEDVYGNQLRIDNFVSYISSLSLINTDGSTLLLKDYSLINFAQDNTLEFTVPKGDYTGIRFLIGVPADVNTDTDPAQYPNSHVLSVAGSQGMFWNWNTGYIFTKLEGKADTSGTNQPLLYSFAYHTGNDHFSKLVTLSKNISINPDATQHEYITLKVDKIFMPESGSGIDISQDPLFHSPGPLMTTFVSNLASAFSLE